MKKIIKALIGSICVVLSLILALSFAGCSEKKKDEAPTSAATADEADATYPVSTGDEAKAISGLEAMGFDPAALGIEPNINNDNNPVGFQLEQPKKGDTIAVIHTGMGDITLRLFPAQAPKTVTNFVNLAKAGKYNNTTFHRVINDFVIQGGHSGEDPKHPNGISSYGSEFEDEFCNKLFNIRGAVSTICGTTLKSSSTTTGILTFCRRLSTRTATSLLTPRLFPTRLRACTQRTAVTQTLTAYIMPPTEETPCLRR